MTVDEYQYMLEEGGEEYIKELRRKVANNITHACNVVKALKTYVENDDKNAIREAMNIIGQLYEIDQRIIQATIDDCSRRDEGIPLSNFLSSVVLSGLLLHGAYEFLDMVPCINNQPACRQAVIDMAIYIVQDVIEEYKYLDSKLSLKPTVSPKETYGPIKTNIHQNESLILIRRINHKLMSSEKYTISQKDAFNMINSIKNMIHNPNLQKYVDDGYGTANNKIALSYAIIEGFVELYHTLIDEDNTNILFIAYQPVFDELKQKLNKLVAYLN